MTQPYMMEQPVVPPVPNLQTVPTVPQEVQTPKQPEPEQEIDEQEQLAKVRLFKLVYLNNTELFFAVVWREENFVVRVSIKGVQYERFAFCVI